MGKTKKRKSALRKSRKKGGSSSYSNIEERVKRLEDNISEISDRQLTSSAMQQGQIDRLNGLLNYIYFQIVILCGISIYVIVIGLYCFFYSRQQRVYEMIDQL